MLIQLQTTEGGECQHVPNDRTHVIEYPPDKRGLQFFGVILEPLHPLTTR